MIECSEDYFYYKKCKKKKPKRFLKLLAVICFITAIILYVEYVVFGLVFNICSDYAYSYSSVSVNNAVLDTLYNNEYGDLFSVERNSSGDITLISVDYYKVNILNNKVSINTRKLLENKLKNGVPIPFFAFTGISFISGLGREINLKSINVSSVVCNFRDEFKSAGINQTLYSVYIDVDCSVSVEFPLKNKITNCRTSVLVSETVLVGKIPEVYLNRT